MEITFDGMTNPQGIICYTGFPNILEVSDPNSGTKAKAEISINGYGSISTEYTLVVNGQTLKTTPYYNQAHGNRFLFSTNNTGQIRTAYSLAEALRSIPTLAVNYNIYVYTGVDGSQTTGTIAKVVIQAKQQGSSYDLTVTGTFISASMASVSLTNGTSSSTLLSGSDNQIIVDIYEGQPELKPLATTRMQTYYVTQLRKTHYGDSTYFDLTPILASLAEYGVMKSVVLHVYSLNDGVPTLLGNMGNIFYTTGYSVNQQAPFIQSFTNVILAQNVQRGDPKPYYNNTILYLYNPTILLSLITAQNVNTRTLTIDYYNSAMVQIKSEDYPITTTKGITDVSIGLDADTFPQTHYVTVTIPDLGTIRYRVIKPLKATDENQRICWRNSMGGQSFFDFTGQRTEQRKTKTDYYQKQDFSYYKTGKSERNLVYDKQITITVNLTTQYLERDSIWQLFDLQNSTNAWTEVNGKTYLVNITDIKVTESNVSGIYNCTIQYEYSMGDTY